MKFFSKLHKRYLKISGSILLILICAGMSLSASAANPLFDQQWVTISNNGSTLVMRLQIRCQTSGTHKLNSADIYYVYDPTYISGIVSYNFASQFNPASGGFGIYASAIVADFGSYTGNYNGGSGSATDTWNEADVSITNENGTSGSSISTGTWLDVVDITYSVVNKYGSTAFKWDPNIVSGTDQNIWETSSTHFNDGTYNNMTISALPVTLTEFDAVYQDDHVNLNWTTASEINNAYFEIERSTDTKDWTTIGQVQGHGNSNVINYYTAVDNLADVIPSGAIYYRLKQVDFNGNFTYSFIRTVNISTPVLSVQVYPNPVSTTLNVVCTNSEAKPITLRLITMNGITEYEQILNGIGIIKTQIDMSRLLFGAYNLEVIQDNNIIENQRIIKN